MRTCLRVPITETSETAWETVSETTQEDIICHFEFVSSLHELIFSKLGLINTLISIDQLNAAQCT